MTFHLPQCVKFKNSLLYTTTLSFIISAQPGFAETVSTEEWQISADKVTRYEKPQSIVAEGNIVLQKIRKLPPPLPKQEKVTEWDVLLEEKAAPEEITAEDITANQEPVEETEVTIRADWIAYDVVLQNIKARGNIQIESKDDTLYADKADINLTGETGSFSDATIIRREKDLHFEGHKIQKTGVNSYYIEDGWAITCAVKDGETPPWSIASSETTIEPGGYAILKHARFRIKNVPVFYTPFFVVPVKNTRQTGFLFPEFSNSTNNGIGFNFPLFVNLSESSDMTIYPEYYTNRGAKPGVEFRYVLSATNKGSIMGSYLDDDLSDPSETEYYTDTGFTHTNSERYWLRGKMDHAFSNNLQLRADLDIVSDEDYLTEFNSGSTGFDKTNKHFLEVYGRGFNNKTENERENSLKLLKSWNGMSLEASVLAINDVRPDYENYTITTTTNTIDPVTGKETVATTIGTAASLDDIVEGTSVDPVTGQVVTVAAQKTPSPLWKLPSLAFTGSRDISGTGVTFGWNADYVNYYREEGISGQRVDLHPVLSSALPLGQLLESRAALGVRNTYYMIDTNGEAEWNEDDSQNRFIFDFFTEVETTLVKDFHDPENKGSGFTHEMRPYISYSFISDDDQESLPYFDSVDRILEKNSITYGIDNFFDLFGNSQRQYGYFKISQSFSFLSENSDEPFSDIHIKLGWNPIEALDVTYKTRINVYDGDFPYHSFAGTYANSRGDTFGIDYSYNEIYNVDQINGSLKAHLFDNWLLKIKVEHSLAEDETNEGNVALVYQALCWSVEFKTQYTPSDTTYMLTFNLANIGVPIGVSM